LFTGWHGEFTFGNDTVTASAAFRLLKRAFVSGGRSQLTLGDADRDPTQPTGAAFAASVAAYDPELMAKVLPNASWIAVAWAPTAVHRRLAPRWDASHVSVGYLRTPLDRGTLGPCAHEAAVVKAHHRRRRKHCARQ
jgi:hypothetical protein